MLDVLFSLDGGLLAFVTSLNDSPAVTGGRKLAELLQGLNQMSPIQVSSAEIPWSVLVVAGASVAGALILLLLLFRGKSRRNRRRHSRFN